MSFVNAGREIQRFIIDKKYNTPTQEIIMAVMDARRFNSTIVDTDGESSDFTYGPGKLRELKISYYPIRCDVIADSRPANLCVDGVAAEPKQERFAIAENISTRPQKLYVNDLRLVDANYNISQHAKAQINASLGALEKQLAIDITSKIVAHKGLHIDGTEYGNRVTMSQTTNGLLTPIGLWTIQKEQNDAAFTNTFIVGSTEVWNWRKAYGIASENTTLGQDFSKLGVPHLYYDINLNTVMGVVAGQAEYILTFDPEALKFVTFSRNAGMFATDLKSVEDFDRGFKSGGLYSIRGTFISPRYGLAWDFYAKFNDCDGEDGSWSWFLSLDWDIVFPTIQACNIQGVNGIMLYKTCPVVIPDCPTGTTPSPAAVSRIFNWVPNVNIFTPALLVSDLTIGGINTQPNVLVNNITELAATLNANYQGQAVFTVSGAAIRYTGYQALTGEINNGAITITFA